MDALSNGRSRDKTAASRLIQEVDQEVIADYAHARPQTRKHVIYFSLYSWHEITSDFVLPSQEIDLFLFVVTLIPFILIEFCDFGCFPEDFYASLR